MKTPLMIGTVGPEIDATEESRLKKINPVSIIMFARNFASPSQMLELNQHIKQILGDETLIALDHEGGRVVRFNEGLPELPDPRELAKQKSAKVLYDYAKTSAAALKEWGFDLNLAPVVDVFTDTTHQRMHTRTFGEDPGFVGEMGVAFIEGMHAAQMQCCAKHFPGGGFANLDPHDELPIISVEKEQQDQHLKPFQMAIEAGVDTIMISHMIYNCYDAQKSGTLSHKIITGLLKKQLGFKGKVLSDDLEMGAIATQLGMNKAAPMALEAGCDIVLSCNMVEKQNEAYESLSQA